MRQAINESVLARLPAFFLSSRHFHTVLSLGNITVLVKDVCISQVQHESTTRPENRANYRVHARWHWPCACPGISREGAPRHCDSQAA
ncbi:hypothetical protein VTK73DRAFT_8280 [Phialemonium thermophilum]|uniref:Uncharacterized protein n=1 Tax=Phialemonium thermophilum TaxID=223376 RepID=A0ABR3W9D4_9PEZI